MLEIQIQKLCSCCWSVIVYKVQATPLNVHRVQPDSG